MRQVEIAVIGGGPAGLSAAIAAASRDAAVTLFDEGVRAGGQLDYRIARQDDGRRPSQIRDELLQHAVEAGVEIESGAVVWGIFAGNELSVSSNGESTLIGFDRVILATGSTDLMMSFAGSSLPGVFTARALQILMHRHRVLPGRRFAVIGDGPDAAELCDDIAMSGGTVVVRVPSKDAGQLVASGDRGIERVAIDGAEHQVDAIAVALGRQPDPRLAIMADCATAADARSRGFVPVRDELLRTSNASVFAAGEIAGPCGIATSIAEGRFAGVSAAASLGLVAASELEIERTRFEAVAPGRVSTGAAHAFIQFAGQETWL